jgi:choline dehydrogenase
MAAAYDYIIVGGSSGCVLANRLTEDPACKVLLLEAGERIQIRNIHMPVGFAKMTTDLTWGLNTVPQKHANNREIAYAQGRVIGGGVGSNAEVYTRGHPSDYDRWANEEGATGWLFKDVQPYFLKAEGTDTLAGEWQYGRPAGRSNLRPQKMSQVFVQACQQYGMPYNPDFNGPAQAGASVYQTTTRDARCSAAVAYLRPIKDRRNSTILTQCQVSRIVIENGAARPAFATRMPAANKPPMPSAKCRDLRRDRHPEADDVVGRRPRRPPEIARHRCRPRRARSRREPDGPLRHRPRL